MPATRRTGRTTERIHIGTIAAMETTVSRSAQRAETNRLGRRAGTAQRQPRHRNPTPDRRIPTIKSFLPIPTQGRAALPIGAI